MLLRPADPADALAVARVHVRAWRAGYRGLIPDAYLDAMRPEERAARYTFGLTDPAAPHTIVADDAGTILGFATTVPGELAALHVDPDHWRRGIGRQLVTAARARLGAGPAIVWVLAGNTRAEQLYLADGWQPDGTHRDAEVWGVRVSEIRFARMLP
ncbi:MAG: N-acetyltransferase family protein [Acidobacteriota bacterium]